MIIRHYHHIIFLACMLLSACVTSPSRPASSPSPVIERSKNDTAPAAEHPSLSWAIFDREKHASVTLLVYGKRFADSSAEQQKKEQTQVMQSINRNKKDTSTRLKAAMILSLPGSRYRDSTRALSLLNDLQHEKGMDDDVVALVTLLKSYVEEQQRLEDSSTKLNQKIKDEQHRADELQQKLDALKDIEKTMTDRGQGTTK